MASIVRRRSRSPGLTKDRTSHAHRRSYSTHPHAHHKHRPKATAVHPLPLHARPLSKHDYPIYKPLFALYLDIQKQLMLEDLSETEARGRWKSFVRKWNCAELAEGWYDSATLPKAAASAEEASSGFRLLSNCRASPDYDTGARRDLTEDSDDDDIGPALPQGDTRNVSINHRSGPAIPNLQDIELRREFEDEEEASRREVLRNQRLMNRKQEKERLDELVPRAEAGSKERMMEKKKENAATNQAFASAKTEGGGIPEISDAVLMGTEDGGIEGFKKQKREMERKKNEREIRREEVMRARAEEREERVKQYKAKEQATMKGLIELAKARFG